MEAKRNITNDIVTDYINRFYEPLTDDLGNLRKEAEEANVPIILKETESFLKTFLGILSPARILEVGCAVGYSAIFFAECTGAKVYTIEKNPEVFEIAVGNIEKLGYGKQINVFEGDGEEVINALKEDGEAAFDLIFIDAAKSHYKRFFDACLPLCGPDTVIVCDNVLFKARVADDIYDPTGKYKTNIKKMREFIDYIMKDSKMDSTIMAVGDGLSITRFKSKELR